MADTTIKESTSDKDLSAEIEDSPQARLANFLAANRVGIFTDKDFQPSRDTEQTPEEIQAEVDGFLLMREEWRSADRNLRKSR